MHSAGRACGVLLTLVHGKVDVRGTSRGMRLEGDWIACVFVWDHVALMLTLRQACVYVTNTMASDQDMQHRCMH